MEKNILSVKLNLLYLAYIIIFELFVVHFSLTSIFKELEFFVQSKFGKAGRVWCGGARETHWTTCHNGVTSIKRKETLQITSYNII